MVNSIIFKRTLCELIGTYALMFFGTGAIVINDLSEGVISHLGIALAFGFTVLCMIHSFGKISGAHINPAVSIAFWLSGRLSGKLIIPYLISQFIGGCLASFSLFLLFEDHQSLGATLPSGSALQSFILEIILSFFLMLVIFSVSHGAKEEGLSAGIAVGATVFIEALVAGPISGASMNPVRSIAPAIVSQNFAHLWIYLTAPILGMLLAIPAYRLTHYTTNNNEI